MTSNKLGKLQAIASFPNIKKTAMNNRQKLTIEQIKGKNTGILKSQGEKIPCMAFKHIKASL